MKFHYFLKYFVMPSEVFLKVTFYLFQLLNCQLFQMKRAGNYLMLIARLSKFSCCLLAEPYSPRR